MRRSSFAALWRFRPRVLTLAVFLLIATLIALANLCSEVGPYMMYAYRGTAGWPLAWHWHHFSMISGPNGSVTWDYDGKRLAGNVAIWLAMAATPAAACEWLLRRCRPRLRWSLRTMLAGVALAGACCGWFVMARKRAETQDPLIVAVRGRFSPQLYGGAWYMDQPARVWVKRRGPKWFDLVGADRYCRRIVGADIGESPIDDKDDESAEQLLTKLAQIPDLRYVFFDVKRLTPNMVDALHKMSRLEMLSIQVGDLESETSELLAEMLADKRDLRVLSVIQRDANEDGEHSRECLGVIGRITQLEKLHLACMTIDADSLASLAGLTKLKSLSLVDISSPNEIEGVPEPRLLAKLPGLPGLESLDLADSRVDDRDLGSLSVFPRLKSLSLTGTEVTGAGLEQLVALPSLEEAAIDGDAISAAALESLLAVKRLARLHLGSNYSRNAAPLAINDDGEVDVPQQELEGCVGALEALRRTKPGIVIDANRDALEWPGQYMTPSEFERIPGPQRVWALQFLREWNK